MKIFLYTLYAVFLFAMGMGFYVAFSGFEGLVEENYYEKASGYFTAKAVEDSLGLEIVLPDTLKKGNNTVDVALFAEGRPLQEADVTFFAGNVSENRHDEHYPMTERLPGVYTAEVPVPFAGTWLMRVDVTMETIKTGRKWFTEVE